MWGKIYKVFLCLILFISANVLHVKAATFHNGNQMLNSSSYGISGYSTIYAKKVDNSIAYCPEYGVSAPSNGQNLTAFGSIYSKDNYVAGQIIKICRDTIKNDSKKQYVYISGALNCYYGKNVSGYNKSLTSTCNNSTIKNIVDTAKRYVNNYKYVNKNSKSSLPVIKINPASGNMTKKSNSTKNNATYVSSAITISGLDETYYGSVGTKYTTSTKPKYTISLESSKGNAKLCTNSEGTAGCLNNNSEISNGTYYLVVSNADFSGGKAKLKINGTNTSKYPSSKSWNGGSGRQRLITYTDNVTVTRNVSKTATFTFVVPEKYSASIAKVDETGEPLSGASLKLFTAADAEGKNDKKTLCTTNKDDANGSCSRTGIMEGDGLGYNNGRYICYSEEVTPNGYTKISTHCDKIVLGNSNYYYKSESSGSNETAITKEEYDKSKAYTQGTDLQYQFHIGSGSSSSDYLYNASSTMYRYEYSDGRNTEYKTSNEEYKHTETVDDGQGGTTTVESWYIEDSGDRVNITVTPIQGKQVCYNETAGVSEIVDYCSGVYQYNVSLFTSGNADIYVGNALNYVNISKKAITGDDEIPGATLSIYKADSDGKCTSNLAKAKRFVYSPYTAAEGSEENTTDEQGNSDSASGSSEEQIADEETSEGNDNGEDIAASGLQWVSSDTPATVYGLDAGNYCMKEQIPPAGYKVSPTTVKFTMTDTGEIKNVEKDYYDEKTKTLVIKDEYTSFSISKADIGTSKEIPGAHLKICAATKNKDGKYEIIHTETGVANECIPDLLADGTEAAWTSGTEPHKVVGLAAGTYYLIETTAPNGYVKAESILFTLKEDGTLTDVNGNSLANNKITMYDDYAIVPKTFAHIPLIILAVGLLCIFFGFGGYYLVDKNGSLSFKKKYKK